MDPARRLVRGRWGDIAMGFANLEEILQGLKVDGNDLFSTATVK